MIPNDLLRYRSTLITAALLAALPDTTRAQGFWEERPSGTTASLRGLHVVSDSIVWASGARGTVLRSKDGGATWTTDSIPGASRLDIRGIHARGALVAHAAATAGRIWRTLDGGKTWSLRYQASDTSVFLDAIAFWDDRRGIALGDPLDERFFILLTDDGGETWREAPAPSRPLVIKGEAAFAASGTTLIVGPGGTAWIGSGVTAARVHRTSDWGKTWQVADVPIQSGAGSNGIFSLAFFDRNRGIAVGGDYTKPDSARASAAYTTDGGVTWHAAATLPGGFRSGVAVWAPPGGAPLALATGTNGTDISRDGGRNWVFADSTGFNAIQIASGGVVLAVGDRGRVVRLDLTKPIAR